MADFLGSYNAVSSRTTVRFAFTTHAASGAAVAPSSAFENADLKIYKDGSATERSSASGITMTSPFDSVTGLHLVSIDLTDNTDAGFWSAGSFYAIVLAPDETVDSLAVVKVLAYFEIGPPQVNVTQLLGTAWLAPAVAGTPDVNTKLAGGTAWGSGAITAASIATDAITAAKIADGAIDTATFASGTTIPRCTLVDTLTTYTGNTPQTGDVFPLASTEIADIKAKTDLIPAAPASTTNITGGTITTVTNLTNAPTSGDLTATMKTSVQTAAEAGLVTHRLDELLNADSDIDGTAPPTVGSVFHEMLSKTAGSFTFDQATDSLEAIRDRGDAAWVTATGFSTHTAADVWASATRRLTDGTNIVLAKGVGVTGFNDIAATAIVSAGAITTLAGAVVTVTTTGTTTTIGTAGVDAVWAKAMTELAAVPGVTDSVLVALEWIFLLARNKITETATTQTLRNNADGATIGAATVSDDGTVFTRGKFI